MNRVLTLWVTLSQVMEEAIYALTFSEKESCPEVTVAEPEQKAIVLSCRAKKTHSPLEPPPPSAESLSCP